MLYLKDGTKLVTVFDIEGQTFVEILAELLKSRYGEIVKPPTWAYFAKTAHFKNNPPSDTDWWYKRAASILRTLYIKGPIGVSRLRKKYGGRKDSPMRKAHFHRAAGNHIRKILQQLERVELVTASKKGRNLTPKGVSLLDSLAASITKNQNVEVKS
ncbi:MAG: 30S ribosomal protein S19e [Thermoproteota archaeon]